MKVKYLGEVVREQRKLLGVLRIRSAKGCVPP